MRLKSAQAYFLAFTAVFAVLAGFVFWGTWSLSACPVMPDAPMYFHSSGYVADFLRNWIGTGKFIPWDITAFIGSPYFWQELQYVVPVYLAALGVAYYLRGRGLSLVSCYGAGLLLGFCGYWLTLFSAGHAGWFRWMASGVFAFGLADRAVRKNKSKNWVLLGACVAWASFYQSDLWFLFTSFTGIYFVWCCFREKRFPGWKGPLVAAAVFFAIGTPSFWNAIVNDLAGRDRQIEEAKGSALAGGEQKDDGEARWIFVTNWSLPPAETLEFFIPRVNGDTSCPMTLAIGGRQGTGVRPYTGALGRPYGAKQGNYRQHSLYVGFITCLLAIAGIVFGRKNREVVFFALAALVFWLLSMGRYFEPLYRIVFMLPFGDYLRAPVKWHHLTELCLCVLAGFGIESLCARLAAVKGFSVGRAAAILGAVAVLGACDLARIDRLYCAAIDLSVVRAKNPAADEILKRGDGKVLDLMEGGSGLVSWSFASKRIEMSGDPNAPDIRFIWAGASQLADNRLAAWLKAKNAAPIGAYALTQRAIRQTAARNANAMLFEIPGIPPSPPDESKPPVSFLTWLGGLSLAATLAAIAYGAFRSTPAVARRDGIW
jgi:hypothetical protein